jgi:hypothetical protein
MKLPCNYRAKAKEQVFAHFAMAMCAELTQE